MPNLYNILLTLSRNIFFYVNIGLNDKFETRLYLMFMHFSIMMIVARNRKQKFNQKLYDDLFHNIENNLRELGIGDVSVNKKMKEFNKILYDILLKLEVKNLNEFEINKSIVLKYFDQFNHLNEAKLAEFQRYFKKFYHFCFEQPLDNMVEEAINFKN